MAVVVGAQAPPARVYGARGMTRKTYWLAQAALGCGSILEWCVEFTLLSLDVPVRFLRDRRSLSLSPPRVGEPDQAGGPSPRSNRPAGVARVPTTTRRRRTR